MKIELSIITVNYNGLDDTCELIDSITFSDRMEVIVVDNGSISDEASAIESRYPHVKVVRSAENLGFAGGNNLGVKASHGDYLFFINNDTILPPDFDAETLVGRLRSAPSVGAVCPKIRFAWNDKPVQFAGYTPLSPVTLRNSSIGFGQADHGQFDTAHTTPYAHGAAMMVKREAVEKAGLMPECYFLYYEELDWSLMIRRTGYEIWYDPVTTVYHKESQTTGADSPLRTYYITRNRLLFARRNIARPLRWLSYFYIILIACLKDAVLNLLRRRTDLSKAVVAGVCDFLRNRQGKKQ